MAPPPRRTHAAPCIGTHAPLHNLFGGVTWAPPRATPRHGAAGTEQGAGQGRHGQRPAGRRDATRGLPLQRGFRLQEEEAGDRALALIPAIEAERSHSPSGAWGNRIGPTG